MKVFRERNVWVVATLGLLAALIPGALAAQTLPVPPPAAPAAAPAKPARPAAKKHLQPRELSPAERAAVELAVAYLQGGPESWLPRLAKGSPLARLPQPEVLQEIAARVGPADGATWELYTPGPTFDEETAIFGIEYASGLDETVILRLVDEGGWKIAGLRTSSDPVDAVATTWRSTAPAPAGPPPEAAPAAAGLFDPPILLRLGGGLAALLVGLLAAFLLARGGKRPLAMAAGAFGVLAAAGLGSWGYLLLSQPAAPAPAAPVAAVAPAPPPAAEGGFLRLGSLAPLRAALAAGTDPAEIERLMGAPVNDPALQDVRDLWKAQSLFSQANLAAVETLLERFPKPAKHPLVDLLRARLSFQRLQLEGTGQAYDLAIGNGLDHDGIRLESVYAQALTDDTGGAEVAVTLMVEMGSRLPQAWYSAAEIAATQDRMDEAERLLLSAWQAEPAPRADLFGNPILAFLVARPTLFPLFQLGLPDEPKVAPAGVARTPVVLPEGVQAATCGQSLRLSVGTAELLVPGGALLAPAEAVLEGADAWNRHSEDKAMAALPALTASAAAGEALAPRRLRLAEEAAGALAGQNRWPELLALTESVTKAVEKAPSGLVRLRAHALRQVGRLDEARDLLMRLAGTDIATRRPAPGTLFELAELFAASGEYDTAIKLSQKADNQLPVQRGERRRRQLDLDKRLAASYASYRSPHFDVRYPAATGETYARGVSLVLEEERRRLAKWIPSPGSKLVEVHLFPVQEFFSTFGGENVVGLYDGKVRVPFADLQSLHPELVQILSHELAHALIAGQTRDQAPHWFQEGLAEHIEMGTGRVNPLPDLAKTNRALSFPTLEPILSGFAEPQLVDLGYSEAAWTLQFIESRWGVKAIHAMLNAYAAGKTTDQALLAATRLTPADFDRALWKWGTTEAPQARNVDVRRYDQDYAAKLVREEGRTSPGTATTAAAMDELDDELTEGRDEEIRRRMGTWYERYSARTAIVKQALRQVVDAYQPGAPPMLATTCIPLTREASKVLGELPLWTSPDSNVNRLLRGGYQTLVQAGKACQEGRGTDARTLLGRARNQFDQAAALLKPYGMTP